MGGRHIIKSMAEFSRMNDEEKYKRSRNSLPEVFCKKGVLKICSTYTGEHPCRGVISIKLLCNFIEITLWHGVLLLPVFRHECPLWLPQKNLCFKDTRDLRKNCCKSQLQWRIVFST